MVVAAIPAVQWLIGLIAAAAGMAAGYGATRAANSASEAQQNTESQTDSVTDFASQWAVGVTQNLPASVQPVPPAVPSAPLSSGAEVSHSYASPSTGMTYTITLPATPSGLLTRTDIYLRDEALKQAVSTLPADAQEVTAVTAPAGGAAPSAPTAVSKIAGWTAPAHIAEYYGMPISAPGTEALAEAPLGVSELLGQMPEAAAPAVVDWTADTFIATVRAYSPSDFDTAEARSVYLSSLAAQVGNLPTERQREAERELANAATKTGVSNAEDTAERADAQAAVSDVATGVGVAVPAIDGVDWAAPLTGVALITGVSVIAKTLADTSKAVTQGCMQSTGQALGNQLLQSALPMAIPLAFLASPMVQNMANDLIGKALNLIYAPLIRQAPITPDKAPGVGATMLADAVLLGVTAHMFSVAAESQATLKNLGLGYLSAFLVDMAGFQRIAAAYTGAQIQWGLQQPMRYWSLEKFRPMIPSEQNLIRLYGEYAITRPEFNKNMGYQGYPAEWINKLAELADRPLSPMLFRYLAEAGELQDELLDRELKNASYNENTIPTLRRVFQRLAAGELKGQFASAVTYAYRYGHLTPWEFGAQMGELGYSDSQAAKALKASNLDLSVHVSERAKTLYLTQYNAGLIDENDLALRLSGIIAVPELVNIEVALAALKRKPKTETAIEKAAAAEVKQLQAKYLQLYVAEFKKGLLTPAQLRIAIVSTGVSPELATVTASLEVIKTLPTPG